MKFRKNYEPSTDKGMSEFEPSLTKKEMAADCDINNIMAKYKRTGLAPAARPDAIQGDFMTSPETYHEAMNIMASATSAFESLPAEVRKALKYDPARLFELTEAAEQGDAGAIEKLTHLGLLEAKKEEPATPASPRRSGKTQPAGSSAPGQTPEQGAPAPQRQQPKPEGD